MRTIPEVPAEPLGKVEDPERITAPPSARRLLDGVLLAGAVVTAAIVLGSLVISLLGIFTVRHPFVGWGDLVVSDAKAVATGHFQYGDPFTQPLSNPYTPLYIWVFAGLLKIWWWEGWGPVLSMLAVLSALASVVWMMWSRATTWADRLASASFVIVVVLGGLSAFEPNGVYEARPDQMAWCLLVIAAALTFHGLLSSGLSRRRLVAIGLLLTGSVFSKQPSIVPCLVLAALTIAGAPRARDGGSWLRTVVSKATVPLVFAGSSLLLGIGLQIGSRGHAYQFLVTDIFHYGRYITLQQEIKWSFQRTVVTLAVFALVVAVAVWSFLASRRLRSSREKYVAVSAVIFALCPIPTAIAAAMKIGGNFNQLSGPVWTLTLGSCVLLMLLGPSARQLTASGIACAVALVGVGVLPSNLVTDYIGKPRLDQRVQWTSIDPFLLAAAERSDGVYDHNVPSLSVSPDAPHYPAGDFVDRLNSGYVPRYFFDNLVEGRYALVGPMPSDSVSMNYWSAFGRYDMSVAWKLNLLLTRAYETTQDPDTGTFYFAPGPRLAEYRWFADCFGPWAASEAGVGVRVRGSGGLACATDGELQLTEAPGPATTLVTTLRQGEGQATLRFAAEPTFLQLAPLDGRDGITSTTGAELAPLVDQCLTGEGRRRELTMRAIAGDGDWSCNTGAAGPVLEIPAGRGGTAHLSIDVAAADSPSLIASASDGKTAPFRIANPGPP
jgi:hypothetical protein